MNIIEFKINEETWIQIERAPGEFTSMPKSVYDQLQTQQGVTNAN